MRRIGARPLVVVIMLLAGCGGATPKPERSPAPQPAAAPAPALAYVPMQRDLYTQRLVYLLRHGWRTPGTLDATPMSLKTMAELELDAHGSFVRYRLSKSSGSASFDRSVAGHLQSLIDSGARAERG